MQSQERAVDGLDDGQLNNLITTLKLLEQADDPEEAVWFDRSSRREIANIRSTLQD